MGGGVGVRLKIDKKLRALLMFVEYIYVCG